MRSLCLALTLRGANSAQAHTANLDAVAAAPESHRVLFEDDKIRVLRVEIQPGATEPVHEHRWPSIMYFEQPQPITYIEYKRAEGRIVEVQRIDVPALQATQTVRGAAEGPHAVTNRGNKAVRCFESRAKGRISGNRRLACEVFNCWQLPSQITTSPRS